MQFMRCLGVFVVAALLPGCVDTGTAPHDKQSSAPVLAARIEVDLDRIAMASHGITPADVHSALNQFLLARKVFFVDDIKNISILPRHSDTPMKLGQLASVRVRLATKEDALREEDTR